MVKKPVKKTSKSTMAKKTTKKSTKAAVKKPSAARGSAKKVSSKSTPKRATALKNLSNEQLHELVSQKAYEFFMERGAYHGDDHSDWYRAESLVRSRRKA